MAKVGVTFQPDRAYLDLVLPLAVELADYVEVAPETLWRRDAHGNLAANAFHATLRTFVTASGLDVVAHGVGLSLGTADPYDEPRLQRWLARIAEDHATFGFLWYSDHLGATVLDGIELTLPIALPATEAAASVVAERLRRLQAIVHDVGCENAVCYFTLDDWLHEPGFLDRVLHAPRTHLVLDLHNVFTMARNLGVDPARYLEALDLDRVIEIHVSGGSDSDPAWLPSRRVLRLDAHDSAVPEPVWDMLARVAPFCRNLRGVTLERMEGTVEPGDVPLLRRELERVREVVAGLQGAQATASGVRADSAAEVHADRSTDATTEATDAEHTDLAAQQARLARALTRLDRSSVAGDGVADDDGFRLAAMMVARLRFERLMRLSPTAHAWFERDAQAFTRAFVRYHASCPADAVDPWGDGDRFGRWVDRHAGSEPD
ncbi:MAG: DUF692 family protein [Planctomycetota bacterium]